MKSKAKAATVAEKARMARLKEMPCLACEKLGSMRLCGPTEIQHLLSGNKRRGHSFTIPLGSWHHRGIPIPGYLTDNMNYLWGPSLAHRSKDFHAEFGTDDELLERTNQLLENHDACGT